MNKENEIKEMNKFLKGVHMGGATFKDYLDKSENVELKNELSQVISSFKTHEDAITNRIVQLGGNPSDTLGIVGTMADLLEKIKLIPVNNDVEVCNYAISAIEMGIKQGEKFIQENSNLDPSLMSEVQGVVKDYYTHLEKIHQTRNNLQ